MLTMLLLGVVLVIAGLAGWVSGCLSDGQGPVTSMLAGLSLAAGCVLLAVAAARRGYHHRPPGAPPGDMDPEKADLPAPDNPPTR
jgi:hypothetical protein